MNFESDGVIVGWRTDVAVSMYEVKEKNTECEFYKDISVAKCGWKFLFRWGQCIEPVYCLEDILMISKDVLDQDGVSYGKIWRKKTWKKKHRVCRVQVIETDV